MRPKKSWFIVGAILAVIAVALVLAPGAWAASTFKVLHRFTGGTDGAEPVLAASSSTRPGISTARRQLAAILPVATATAAARSSG